VNALPGLASPGMIQVYLETGKQRVFAGALDWPGWCRSGRDESSALAALLEYGPRYALALRSGRIGFRAPELLTSLTVSERMQGNASTDFGVPAIAPSGDAEPIGDIEIRRFQTILRACWRSFDKATKAARGKALRKGPRGGGRLLDAIIHHVLEADGAYLRSLGMPAERAEKAGAHGELSQIRRAILKAVDSAAHNPPSIGPRGGVRWKAPYFVRRVAWHVLDHAWEIEDRML
jgi:hypothetical protein